MNAEYPISRDFSERHRVDHDVQAAHGSLRSYLTGFVLSAVLTAVPFGLVMTGAFSAAATVALVVAFAVAQILVHMILFLHLDIRSDGGWNMLATIFTVIFVAIAITGSLWVMHNMNQHMMPMNPPGEMSGM